MAVKVRRTRTPEAEPAAAPPAPAPRRKKPAKYVIRHVLSRTILYAVLIGGSLVFMAPLVWMISASLQDLGDIFTLPPHWIPKNPSLDNYKEFITGENPDTGRPTGRSSGQIGRWFFNSAFVAIAVTAGQLFFCSIAAYAFAKRRFPARDKIFLLFLAGLMIPGQVTLIPWYIMLKHVPLFGGNDIFGTGGHGWLDSYWGLIVPGMISAWTIFFLRQYMKTIPDELLDAARIDGASDFRTYWQIVLPLARPALGASAIFTFIYVWEDFFGPLILISSPDLYTVPLGMALFAIRNRPVWDLLMAGGVLATIPMLITFVFFQRNMIRGIVLGGVKG
jgi:multiple sugar transport system permease protein